MPSLAKIGQCKLSVQIEEMRSFEQFFNNKAKTILMKRFMVNDSNHTNMLGPFGSNLIFWASRRTLDRTISAFTICEVKAMSLQNASSSNRTTI